jgi:hypothetical protein
MSLPEINSFLADYFEALYTQDLDLFDRVFHSSSVLYSAQNGTVTVRPIAEYRNIVANRASPQSVGQPRAESVLTVDMLSSDMAVVKVRLRLFDGIMEDHLNIMRTSEGWRIFAKFYTRAGDAR